jgi:hypothetical protein
VLKKCAGKCIIGKINFMMEVRSYTVCMEKVNQSSKFDILITREVENIQIMLKSLIKELGIVPIPLLIMFYLPIYCNLVVINPEKKNISFLL